MSSTASVLYCHEAAQACEQGGNFLAAARNYYECYLYYENAELTVSYEYIHEYGSAAMSNYNRCKKLISQEDKVKIREDEITMSFLIDWEHKVDYLDYVLMQGKDLHYTPKAETIKAIEQAQIFTGKTCPYCGKPTELIDSAEIYGGTSYGPIYICRDCDAYVGCYKGTTTALGRLANDELRLAKRRAHHYLDQLWKTPKQRLDVYAWISDELRVPLARTHVGMSDVEQCNLIARICRNRLIERRKKYFWRRFKEWEENESNKKQYN